MVKFVYCEDRKINQNKFYYKNKIRRFSRIFVLDTEKEYIEEQRRITFIIPFYKKEQIINIDQYFLIIK
jgi:hypothetical protein